MKEHTDRIGLIGRIPFNSAFADPRALSNMSTRSGAKASGFSELSDLVGVDEAIKIQKEKLKALRDQVKKLTFKKIDTAGNYSSITYKAFDGGRMGIKFNPFEINVIDIADSNGRRRVRFVIPEISGYEDDDDVKEDVLDQLDKIPEIKKLAKLLGPKLNSGHIISLDRQR